MTVTLLTQLLFISGIVHFCILVASALVPFRLNWREELAGLSRLHRQMYWTYGGYVVIAIVAFGCISVTNAAELARGSGLGLQGVFDVKPHLTAWWLKLGYGLLTVLFAFLAAVYGWAALGAVRVR
jgi:uncharacterized membrane protein YhaH (DUF805 family)